MQPTDSAQNQLADWSRATVLFSYLITFVVLSFSDFKQVVIPTNSEAAEFEASMQMKVMILCGLFYSRQESSSDSKSDFFSLLKEYMSEQDAQFNYIGALSTSFFAN